MLVTLIWGTRLTLRQLKRRPPFLDAPFALAPVSVLKPLKGMEAGLEQNLRAFFELEYPQFELIYSVADAQDPVIAVVEALRTQYPLVDSKLIVGDEEVGLNPKINNLVHSYGRAQYDWLLISDSNTRLEKRDLRRMMGYVDSSTGMITSLVAGRSARGLGGNLEALSLNAHYSRGMCLAYAVGLPVVLGKSMLFRKSMAQRFGGIATLGRYLNEDYIAGEAMRMLGLRIVLAGEPVEQPIGRISLRTHWQRQLRWARIRKAQLRERYIAELLGQSFVSLGLGLLLTAGFWGEAWNLALLGHIALWWFCDWKLQNRMGDSMSVEKHFPLWMLRELFQLPIWIYCICGKTVQWRGRKLRVLSGGILEPLK